MEKNCGTCRSWVPMEKQPGWGQCRQGPPQICFDGQRPDCAFPVTKQDIWCHQHSSPVPENPLLPPEYKARLDTQDTKSYGTTKVRRGKVEQT